MTVIDDIIAKVESGEPIDWNRVRLLVDLEFVRIGQRFAEDQTRRDRMADDAMAKHMGVDPEKIP